MVVPYCLTGMSFSLDSETLVENTPAPTNLKTHEVDPSEEDLPVEEPLAEEPTTQPGKCIFELQNAVTNGSYFLYLFWFLIMVQRKL